MYEMSTVVGSMTKIQLLYSAEQQQTNNESSMFRGGGGGGGDPTDSGGGHGAGGIDVAASGTATLWSHFEF